MSCCGQNRQALKRLRVSVTKVVPEPPATTHVVYKGEISILFRGPVTGRGYWFAPERRHQEVDPQDVRSFIETGLFFRPD
ncbi:MAG: hypothetical protein ACT4O2_01790 [Beijerinckiaceae bacterium]